MAGFPVVSTIQPIIGVDFHKAIPPPPPAPPLMSPHVVTWMSGLSQKIAFMWAIASTSKASSPDSACLKPVAVGFGYGCGRTHDAGPHPGHIWPNILLPLILLGSASKYEFGSGTVKISVSAAGGGSADFAVNVAYFLNLNLDCQDFPIPPLPSGLSPTIHYSVKAGFSWTDFARGMLQMAVDLALTWVTGAICAVVTGAISGAIKGLLGGSVASEIGSAIKSNFEFPKLGDMFNFASNGRAFVSNWGAMGPAFVAAWRDAPVDQVMGVVGGALSTFGLGTPIGYAPAGSPIGGYDPGDGSASNSKVRYGNSAGNRAGTWVDKWHR